MLPRAGVDLRRGLVDDGDPVPRVPQRRPVRAGVDPGELAYVRVTGRRIPGEVQRPLPAAVSREEAERALAGLVARVIRFRDADQAYRSWAAPQFISDRGVGDYDHLARVFEWHVTGAGEDGGDA